ncbi:hypothetical protein D3C81_1234400 [compost metagenome]
MQRAQCAQRHFVVLRKHCLHVRVSSQQVLHYVQALGAVEICRLAGQQFEFVLIKRLFEPFATLTGGRGARNPFQLDHFSVCAHFFSDKVAGHFAANAVVRGDMADHLALACHAVQRNDRDLGLIGHLDGVTHRIGIRWVNQQQFRRLHHQILHVSQLFRRVVLRVQHHQVITQLVGFLLRAFFHGNEERVIQGGHHQRDGVFRQRVSA